MENKSEVYFKQYLKDVTNDQLNQFYTDVECNPFPVLVINEYQLRFNQKNRREVIEKLKIHTELAKEKTRELRSIAKNRSFKTSKKFLNKKQKLSKSIENTNHLIYSEKNLTVLEKLRKLNKKEIITNREFQDKKKEILKRI